MSDDMGNLDVCVVGDVAGQERQAGGYHRLAGNPCHRVLGEDRVEDGVGDLVGHLVGMALGHGLRGEGPLAGHGLLLVFETASRMARAMARLSARGTSVAAPSAPRMTTAVVSCSKPTPGAETSFDRSEEHTSELQSLMRISYAVFYLKK